MNNQTDNKHMYDLCKEHMHSYVLAETVDGSQIDGIITGLDDEYVYMAVPIGGEEAHGNYQRMGPDNENRQFWGYYGYGYPGFGFGPRRRFRRLILPLAALTALSILPWY